MARPAPATPTDPPDPAAPPWELPGPPRHVLLSGGTSGIGLQAVIRLLRNGHRLSVLCRDPAGQARMGEQLGGCGTALLCDLADLNSVSACCDALLAAAEPIDTLVLNAGLQYSGAREPRWSAQGFELTIAVNHLAHHCLLQRLQPLLLRSREPRLVITASEVHDPASPGGRVGPPADLGDLAGLAQGPGAAMIDGGAFHADKAYKDSKLCNLLTAREAERRLREQGAPVPVLAWSPGLVIPRGAGGFFRHSRSHNPVGQFLFERIARDLLRLCETPERAGALLAALATAEPPAAGGFQYWSNRLLGPGRLRFERGEPSEAARSDALARALWRLSDLLLTPDPPQDPQRIPPRSGAAATLPPSGSASL